MVNPPAEIDSYPDTPNRSTRTDACKPTATSQTEIDVTSGFQTGIDENEAPPNSQPMKWATPSPI